MDNIVLSALASCQQWQLALKLFHTMPERDIISTTCVIASCAHQWERAYQLMTHLKKLDQTPNKSSYGALLTACVNGKKEELAKAVASLTTGTSPQIKTRAL